MALVSTIERTTGRIKDQGLLFEYTVKLVVLTAFFELILYRLVSRLGMHLSKVAAQHPWVGSAFRFLSSIGFGMLNVVAIFLFIALAVLVLKRLRLYSLSGLNVIIVPGVALLLLLTAGFLIVEPAMLGSIAYNVISFILLTVLIIEYLSSHHEWAQRLLGVTYYLGISGWLYYQILSTTYGWLGSVAAPPLVYEVNRAGEALMVLSSIIVFWAYGRGVSFLSRNKQQRRRAIWFWSTAGSVFGLLLFFDYFLEFYNPAMAHSIRKASQGIGWIFQMGMGYTFYLPFALYVAGLLLLGLYRHQADQHGTAGRLWIGAHVHRRICPASLQSDHDGDFGGHAAHNGPAERRDDRAGINIKRAVARDPGVLRRRTSVT